MNGSQNDGWSHYRTQSLTHTCQEFIQTCEHCFDAVILTIALIKYTDRILQDDFPWWWKGMHVSVSKTCLLGQDIYHVNLLVSGFKFSQLEMSKCISICPYSPIWRRRHVIRGRPVSACWIFPILGHRQEYSLADEHHCLANYISHWGYWSQPTSSHCRVGLVAMQSIAAYLMIANEFKRWCGYIGQT